MIIQLCLDRHIVRPEQQAHFNFRCDRGREMLRVFTEWWLHPKLASITDPVPVSIPISIAITIAITITITITIIGVNAQDVTIPRPAMLEALRDVILHITVLPDEQYVVVIIIVSIHRFHHTNLCKYIDDFMS